MNRPFMGLQKEDFTCCCGYETGSFSLRKEHIYKESEEKVMRKMAEGVQITKV
jgi:hypothetical protein